MVDEAWLSTVRLARDLGDVSSLFPQGIARLVDLPFTIHNAILSALGFLSYEEMPEKERPPRKIWLDGEKMKAHWDGLKRMHEAREQGHGDQTEMDQGPLAAQLFGAGV